MASIRSRIGENMEDRYLFKAQRLDSEEWVEGALVYDNKDELYRIITEIDYSTGTCVTTEKAPRIERFTACQCTGLKDKNGKLIWENDIVRCGLGKVIVLWDEAQWKVKKWDDDLMWYKDLYFWVSDRNTEVIGNIFDNKELLESEEK